MQGVIMLWNSLPQYVADDESLCEFKERLDRFMDEKSIKERHSCLLRKYLSCKFLKGWGEEGIYTLSQIQL